MKNRRPAASRVALCAVFVLTVLSSCTADVPLAELTQPYTPDDCGSCAGWNAPQEPFNIHGNTWYVGTRGLASILVTSDDGHVLIDGGLPDSAPLILENIAALGFDAKDIRLILHSHPHFDHAGGIAALQQVTGARVAAPEAGAAALRLGNTGPHDPQTGIHLAFPRVADVEPVLDRQPIRSGPLAFTPWLTEGHAPGGTTWSWTSCAGTSCLDMVYADSQTPVSSDDFHFSGSPAIPAFERGFQALESMACDLLMTPHPAASSFWERVEGMAPLLDREACRRYAETGRARLAQRLETESRTDRASTDATPDTNPDTNP